MIGECKVTMIYAQDAVTRGIGRNGKIVWKCSADMKFFKEQTMNKYCVVGKTTAESLPELEGRNLLVLSRSGKEGTYTLRQLINFIKKNRLEEIVVIGGLEVYDLFLKKKYVDLVYESNILFYNTRHQYDTYARFSVSLSKQFPNVQEKTTVHTNDYKLQILEYMKNIVYTS